MTAELTPAHRDYLAAHGIDPDSALSLGVRSVSNPGELPDEWRAGGIGRRLPEHAGILFPWVSVDGRLNIQLRPDDDKRPLDEDGEPIKYVYQKGRPPVLWCVRAVKEPRGVLIVEGSKQCLVAAQHAPEGWAVYGMAGCWGFSHDKRPIIDLEVADCQDVVVALDVDAATNPDVYLAGTRLMAALKAEGAETVRFLQLPAGGKSGLDDVLADRRPEKRAAYLDRLVKNAIAKVAETKPTAGSGKKPTATKPVEAGGRKVVVVNGDQLDVINNLTSAMAEMFSGRTLFAHGEVMSELKGSRMVPVDRGRFNNVIQRAAHTVKEVETRGGGTAYPNAWPEPNAMTAVLSNVEEFTPLRRVATAPFVRPDGSIVTEPGYDEATETVLVPDEALAGLEVPQEPTLEELAAARELIMADLLGDFPFLTEADHANALALLLTPAIRGMVSLAPLAVIDGSTPGVGKGKVASCLLNVYQGHDAHPMTWPEDKEELRKSITSAFRGGSEFFVFDEAHTLDGGALAQALTASTWQDRVLGASNMGNFPNTVTWVSLGNQVKIKGDIFRRVYRIAIQPPYDDPQNRAAHTFRHPHLEVWARENRRELLTAVLIMIRAWFAAGRPRMSRPATFQSFIEWESLVGGIIEHAGVKGFLANHGTWTKGSDPDAEWWAGHLLWLIERFGTEGFTVKEVAAAARADSPNYPGPPGLSDLSEKNYAEKLGVAYRGQKGRAESGLVLDKPGEAHGGVGRWVVRAEVRHSEPSYGGHGGHGGRGSTPTRTREKAKSLPSDEVITRAPERVSRTRSGGEPTTSTSSTSSEAAPPAVCPDAGDPNHDPDFCGPCMAALRTRRA